MILFLSNGDVFWHSLAYLKYAECQNNGSEIYRLEIRMYILAYEFHVLRLGGASSVVL